MLDRLPDLLPWRGQEMTAATMTSKGQITVPKADVRDALGLVTVVA